MQTITTQQLREWRERDMDFILANVLEEDSFQEQHIAGSKNIPVDGERFVERFQDAVGSKDDKVVVYCASKDCAASPRAAKKLTEAGFTNVYDYEAGMVGWAAANLPVESGS